MFAGINFSSRYCSDFLGVILIYNLNLVVMSSLTLNKRALSP